MPCALIINTLTDVFCKLLFKFVSILFYQLGYFFQVFTAKATIACQVNTGLQPKLRRTPSLDHMDVLALFFIGIDFEYKSILLSDNALTSDATPSFYIGSYE